LALSITYFTYEQIRAKADGALAKYHPKGTAPVPVQAIVEFGYEIDVIPIPGLQKVYEVEAFTGRDQKTIHIDQGVFESRSPNRYRFSLAHELGHIDLHQPVFAQLQFSTIEQWKTAMMQFPENQRETLEFQAHDFAGLFLVPLPLLRVNLAQAIRILKRAQEQHSIQPDAYQAKPYVCTWLGKHFEVSADVIERRLTKERLWPPSDF
jgi:Zn-dependent peptidase ImmA (M78 family)